MPDNQKNVLFLLIDALRADIFDEPEAARRLVPTIYSLVEKGALHPIVSNGMITHVAMPAILTQSYPFDCGGYNYGIRDREKSFIEVLKENGYSTHFIATHYITGPHRNYERGCDQVRALFDHRSIIEQTIRLLLNDEIKLWRDGILSKGEILERVGKYFDEGLSYAEQSVDRVDQRNLRRPNRAPSKQVKKKIREERHLLQSKPEAVLEKLESLVSTEYHYHLGVEKVGKLQKYFWRSIAKLKHQANNIFKRLTGSTLVLFPLFEGPSAKNVFDTLFDIGAFSKKPWLVLAHVMDAHEGAKIGSFLHFLGKFRLMPRLLGIRRDFPCWRSIWYDLSLMYVDGQAAKLFRSLEAQGQFDDTLIVVAGDHGLGVDPRRNKALSANLGHRTFYENINVPLIVAPTGKQPSEKGLHDAMSISATLLEELDLPGHDSFKGVSIYRPGKEAVVIECAGRGNCDLENRTLFFTVVTKGHKLMVTLEGGKLIPQQLYDLTQDPCELKDVVSFPESKEIIRRLLMILCHERKEFLEKRVSDFSSYFDDSARARTPELKAGQAI